MVEAVDDAVAGLDDVVDELYVLAPGDFVGRRDELAKAARAGGDKTLAAAARRLKRPTTSAWALNLLSRQEPDLVEQLLELGEALRQAQSGLDGTALRELDTQRRAVVGALARRAGALAAQHGHDLDPELTRQVEQSLGAALADPDMRAAVTSGQLVKPVSVVGFGVEVDPDAVAVPALVLVGARRRRDTSDEGAGRDRSGAAQPDDEPAGKAKSASRTSSMGDARARREKDRLEKERLEQERLEQERVEQERETRRAEAREALAAARTALTEAERAAEHAAAQVADLRARLDELQAEREDLAARLARCEEETAETAGRLTEQEEHEEEADRALRAAQQQTEQAERATDEVDRDDAP